MSPIVIPILCRAMSCAGRRENAFEDLVKTGQLLYSNGESSVGYPHGSNQLALPITQALRVVFGAAVISQQQRF
jgi:hypothetical protein